VEAEACVEIDADYVQLPLTKAGQKPPSMFRRPSQEFARTYRPVCISIYRSNLYFYI
jgi:hypothetical protein